MKQRLFLALAPAASVVWILAVPGLARGGDDWTSLDRNLEALVKSASTMDGDGPQLHGLVRSNWAHFPNDIPVSATRTEDRSGFALDNAQASMEGRIGEKAGYRLQLEGAGGTAVLLDAFGSWDACKYVRVTMGRFRSPLLWESQINDGDHLFILRTDSGELFYTRDDGVMLSCSLGQFHWAASVQDGLDFLEDTYAISARGGIDVLGGGVGPLQGAYGAGSQAKLSLGVGYFDDQSQGGGKDGDVIAADAQLQIGRFAADAMIAKYQEFSDPTLGFSSRSDSLPWNVSASFMVIEDKLEVAGRYQEINNRNATGLPVDAKDFTAGVNYYLDGHAVKLQANAAYEFSNDPNIDDSIRFGIGATVSV